MILFSFKPFCKLSVEIQKSLVQIKKGDHPFRKSPLKYFSDKIQS
jgi:hypothetical protein